MALVNHAKKEINAKIVYFGPAGSGKSTALNYIFSRIKPSLRGDLKSVPAGPDNLLLFDFNPFETPLANGYRVRLHIYTLTGIVTNPATWKMTLKGADGIIIMINPAADHAEETRESVSQLRDFLSAYGVGLHETPAIVQCNSFTQGNQAEEATGTAELPDLSTLTTCSSNAACGEGVLEALTTLSRQVLDRITVRGEQSETDIVAADPPSESENTEKDCHEGSAHSSVMSQSDESPRIILLSREVVSEGRTIRIPLEVSQGDSLRKLVISVNVDLE